MEAGQEKQKLREQFLQRRLQLRDETYLTKSARIIERLKQQPEYQDAEKLHCYVSMQKRHEVNTIPFIKELLDQDKKLAVPVTDFQKNVLHSRYITRFEDLQENKWGVLEPVAGEIAKPGEFDLVIVPMVGGDYNKNRIGYGKGFYDRFLSESGGAAVAVGLLFEDCLVESIPIEEFDIPMDKLITEERVIA